MAGPMRPCPGLCTTQLLAEYSVDSQRSSLISCVNSQRPSQVVLVWTLSKLAEVVLSILIAITRRTPWGSKFLASARAFLSIWTHPRRQPSPYAPYKARRSRQCVPTLPTAIRLTESIRDDLYGRNRQWRGLHSNLGRLWRDVVEKCRVVSDTARSLRVQP